MVENTLRAVDSNISFRKVHASRGKVTRAEPISALYEQGKVHHVGAFNLLEDQMCKMTIDFDSKKAGYSPDRLDALVWALTALMVRTVPPPVMTAPIVTGVRRWFPGMAEAPEDDME